MAHIDRPPFIKPAVDTDGYVKLTQEEFAMLMLWLEKMKRYLDTLAH